MASAPRTGWLVPAATVAGLVLTVPVVSSAQVPANQGLVVRDGSLGDAPAGVVAPGVDPLGRHADYLIAPELGEQRGGNLFHSFDRFGIGTDETATFTGPDPVDGPQSVSNIISRVTGSEPSEIDGTLRSTVPGADVYLLNPAGLLFGPSSRLDLGGSFHASTADSLAFDTAEVFEARAGGGVPLLAVAAPAEFGFLTTNSSPITLDGTLSVPKDASLSLIGAADLTVSGSLAAPASEVGVVTIRGGTVTVEGSGSIGIVAPRGGSGGSILIEGSQDVTLRGFVSASPGSPTRSGDAGNVTIRGGTVTIAESGFVSAEAGRGEGGHIELEGRDVSVGGFVSASALIGGDAGSVMIRGRTVTVDQASTVGAFAGSGNGGRVELQGRETATVLGVVQVTSEGGNAGRIGVSSGSVTIADSASLAAEANVGSGGRIELHGRDELTIDGSVSLSSGIFGGDGDAGALVARGGTVTVGDLGAVRADARGSGDGGRVELAGDLFVRGSLSAEAFGSGSSGTISFQGPLHFENDGLVVRDGSVGGTGAAPVSFGFDPFGRLAYYLITPELGVQHGSNLFHSFQRFGIGPGEIAVFTGPDPVEGPQSVRNVIGRVTGGERSEIRGSLRSTISGADVYLLNPAGVMFGSGARLDVGASFHASTADELRFGSDELFEVRQGGVVPTMGTGGPIGVGFLDTNASPIVVDGTRLEISNGGSLSLIGAGRVTIDGSLSSNVTLGASGDVTIRGDTVAVEESAVLTSGVGIGSGGNIELEGRRVTLRGSVSASAILGHAGTVTIRGDHVTIGEAGLMEANSREGDAGSVTIRGGSVTIEESGVVETHALAGNGGSVEIDGSPVIVRGSVSVASFAAGEPGSLTIRGGPLIVESSGAVIAGHQFIGDIRGGHIAFESDGLVIIRGLVLGSPGGSVRVRGRNLTIELFGTVEVSGSFEEDGGRVELEADRVTARGRVAASEVTIHGDDLVIDPAQALIGERVELDGKGGVIIHGQVLARESVAVRGRNVILGGLGRFNVGPFNFGDDASGGRVQIDASEHVTLDSGEIRADSLSGAAGEVRIRAGSSLKLSNQSTLQTVSREGAGSGSILLEAPLIVLREGSTVVGEALGSGTGGGSVEIHAERMEILGGSSAVFAFSPGGAELQIVAEELLIDRGTVGRPIPVETLEGVQGDPGRFVLVPVGAAQASGNVELVVGQLRVTGGGSVEGSTAAPVSGGRIRITARDSVRVSGPASRIESSTSGEGSGGSIRIDTAALVLEESGEIGALSKGAGRAGDIEVVADRLSLTGAAAITTESQKAGNAGRIRIDARDRVELTGGRISTEAAASSGGSIVIEGPELLDAHESEITASVGGDQAGGNVTLSAREIDLLDGTVVAAESTGSGRAGSVLVSAGQRLGIAGRSTITSQAEAGSGGSVTVDGGERLDLDDSVITASVEGENPGGDVRLAASEISLGVGTIIAAKSEGSGSAGTIDIDAGRLGIQGSEITTAAGEGGGGNVEIELEDTLHSIDSSITASVTSGSGGNVTIGPSPDGSGPVFVILEGSDITADASGAGGFGGHIAITADAFLADASSTLDASAPGGPQFAGDGRDQRTRRGHRGRDRHSSGVAPRRLRSPP